MAFPLSSAQEDVVHAEPAEVVYDQQPEEVADDAADVQEQEEMIVYNPVAGVYELVQEIIPPEIALPPVCTFILLYLLIVYRLCQ